MPAAPGTVTWRRATFFARTAARSRAAVSALLLASVGHAVGDLGVEEPRARELACLLEALGEVEPGAGRGIEAQALVQLGAHLGPRALLAQRHRLLEERLCRGPGLLSHGTLSMAGDGRGEERGGEPERRPDGRTWREHPTRAHWRRSPNGLVAAGGGRVPAGAVVPPGGRFDGSAGESSEARSHRREEG